VHGLLEGGVPGQEVVEGVKGVKYTPILLAMYEKWRINRQFLALFEL
jgi:hypothetical protein